uniref:(northern house mosquito) hypothetical protein n=1 Tax=Culex pipiens TaxID=7175 RepID=A0A8D8FB13_CULPI
MAWFFRRRPFWRSRCILQGSSPSFFVVVVVLPSAFRRVVDCICALQTPPSSHVTWCVGVCFGAYVYALSVSPDLAVCTIIIDRNTPRLFVTSSSRRRLMLLQRDTLFFCF